MSLKKIRFGELELKLLYALEEKERVFLGSKDIQSILGVSKVSANKTASRLTRKKRLIRLRKGLYLFAPFKSGAQGLWTEHALAVLSHLFGSKEEYSISYWTGLSHYSLTEQLPLGVQVKVTRLKRGFKALGSKFQFILVKKIGEIKVEKAGSKELRFATVEQLVVDCLARPKYCGGVEEVAKAIWNYRSKMNWGQLVKLARESNDAVPRRLGFIIQKLGLKIPQELRKKYDGLRLLDPSVGVNASSKSKEWGLKVNVDTDNLVGWMKY